MKYILYCAQEANFQTRSMLIPYELLPENRLADLSILKKHSKPHTFTFDGKDYHVDNLLIQNIIWERDGNGNRSHGYQEITEYLKIINEFTRYADGMDEDCYLDLNDKNWCDSAILNLCGGFNNIKNYCQLRSMTSYEDKPIEIIDGFLVLETDDGKLNLPSVDTVEEMFQKYYPGIME